MKLNGNLTFGSVCSGIEAASCAWLPLGWQAAWLSEIEPFPSAVLAYRHPDTPNLGDMTKIAPRIIAGDIPAPDVLVGGTPCQAFSVAGLRGGMEDARGALTLKYVELANAIDNKRTAAGLQPVIAVWENVPGVLSSSDNAFGCFLAGLAGEDEAFEPGERPEPGKNNQLWRWNAKTGIHIPKWPQCGCVYGPQRKVAWRILDAQYFGVAQRRRRIFVVASARTDIDPAKILLEFDGVRRDIAPGRSTGKAVAGIAGNSVKVGSLWDNQANPHPTLNQSHNIGGIGQSNQEIFSQRGSGIVSQTQFGVELAATLTSRHDSSPCADRGMNIITMAHGQGGAEIKTDDAAPTLTCNHEAPIVFSSNGHASFSPGVSALRAKSGADHETLAVHGTQDPDTLKNLAHTLGRNHGQENAVIAFQPGNCTRNAGASPSRDVFPTLKSDHGRGMSDQFPHVAIAFGCKDYGQDAATELSPTIRAGGSNNSHANAGSPPAVAFCLQHAQIGRKDSAGPQGKGWQKEVWFTLDSRVSADAIAMIKGTWWDNQEKRIHPVNGGIYPTLSSRSSGGGTVDGYIAYPGKNPVMSVRRLTPVECERLQGFPDNWTLIPTTKRRKITEDELAYLREYFPDSGEDESRLLAADGPRYKAIGNSMAVPVMRWIGERIEAEIASSVPVQPQKVAYLRQVREPKAFVRPFLKWVGGKFSVLPVLSEHLPHGKRLIEPFVGGGAVFTNAGYSRSLLNDVNSDLINVYQVLQREGHSFITLAYRYFQSYNDEKSYLDIRRAFNAHEFDDLHRAAAFLYINRHCFNGLVRYNQKGQFNVGFGKYKKPYFPHEEMEAFLGTADQCEFLCGDFGGVIAAAGDSDVIFCDPPYEPLPDTNGFTNYSGHEFPFDEQERLVSLLVAAHSRGAKVVTTNSGAPVIRELFEMNGFTIHRVEARRSVSCKGETRAMANDVIATLGC